MPRFKIIQTLAWVLVLLVSPAFINADISRLINYQGYLTDDTGQPVEDGEYPMQFKIHDDSIAYSPVWTSQPETILVINGIFNFQLGSKESIPALIFANDSALWLAITVGSGPEPEEIAPRTRLAAAPYAFQAYHADYAGYADSAVYIVSSIGESGEYDGIVNTDMVETDPGGATTINFASAFTSTEKLHFYITVVLKQAANGLVEGTAIKAVEDIKGASGNWTGFDITVSKYSDGSSITDNSKVYVTWMAIGR